MEGPTHCLFYVYPLKSGETQARWCVDQVLRRQSRFSGRKIATISTGPETLPFDQVRPWFPWDWTVLHIENKRTMWEVGGWKVMWPLIAHEKGQALWLHAKGVTRVGGHYETQARDWTEILYRTLLDFPLQVGEVLRAYPLAGSLKKVQAGFEPESHSQWHYHGGMYWVREDLFPKWGTILDKWFGGESWPGEVVPPEQGGLIFGTRALVRHVNMYNTTYSEQIKADLKEWAKTTLDYQEQDRHAVSDPVPKRQ